jgi:chromosome segregation ATPase
MDERALAFIHELEQADETVAVVLAELDDLARETEAVRARALELAAFMIRLPAKRERIATALAEAERHAGERRAGLRYADQELAAAEQSRDAERLMRALPAASRARDAALMAERKVESLESDLADLEQGAGAAEREATELETRTRTLAEGLRTRSGFAEHAGDKAQPGLVGVSEWASGARAALFVARGRLAAEREALIRQANELGALVLEEPLTASSAAVVARRVERASGA